jgi:pyrroloquinoline quinone biosynthesis protein D
MTVSQEAKPRLRRGVRLSYDSTRQATVLLHPEGVLLLNDTAVAVLERCDGETSVPAIVHAMSVTYQGVRTDDVVELLTRLEGRRLVVCDE